MPAVVPAVFMGLGVILAFFYEPASVGWHSIPQIVLAVVEEALRANGLAGSDIDWLVPHQANRRIIDGMARKLGLPSERVVVTVDRHANTSAASIPLATSFASRALFPFFLGLPRTINT